MTAAVAFVLIRVVVVLHLTSAPEPVSGGATSVCTAGYDNAYSREVISVLLVGPEFAEQRLRHGLGEIPPSSLRVLQDDRDAAVCTFLRGRIIPGGYYDTPPWVPVFYEAGGFYFMTAVRYPPEEQGLRLNPDGTLSGTIDLHPVTVYNMHLDFRFGEPL